MLSDNDRAVLNSIFNPLLPLGEGVQIDVQDVPEDNEELSDEMKKMQKEGILCAENGRMEEAIEIFSEIIAQAEVASAYNNRAQVYRLLGKDEEAMRDLDVSLIISERKGRSGCSALCQRGLLYRKSCDNELAKADFEEASRLGSQFAKQQLVEMNPYAAMCNQMLNEMMLKLSRAELIENGHPAKGNK